MKKGGPRVVLAREAQKSDVGVRKSNVKVKKKDSWRGAKFEPQAAHLRPTCCESMQIVWNDECGLVPVLSAECMRHGT